MNRIADIIKQGESEVLEFKGAFGKEVIETAVAFANTRGGMILIGVNDQGLVVGQSFGKEVLRDYVNRIAVATEPSVIPDAEKIAISDGEVILLSVPEFPLKPIATRGRCYRRAGSTTRQMTPSEIAEMHMHSTGSSMDAVVVQGKSKGDINLEGVLGYMHQATAQGRRSFSGKEDPWQVLMKLELVKSEREITRAAILLFGKNPQSPLMQAVVHAGRLREKVHIMDNRIIEGTIIDQVEETVEFIKKNLHVRFEISGDPQRKEVWDYPLPALREAVINAIVHRDYGDTADIQIKIFEDALQIWSPGFLPYNMKVRELLDPEHTSKPRNKLIAQIFYDMGLIERYGSGIHRVLLACRDAALPEPLFENFSGGFRIKFILPKQTAEAKPPQEDRDVGALNEGISEGLNEGLNEGINALLEHVKKSPGQRVPQIEHVLNIPSKTIERWIAVLKERGAIEYRGSKKTGGYFACT